MINLAVINLKEFTGLLLKIFFGIILFLIICNMIRNIKNGDYTEIETLKKNPILGKFDIIDKNILLSKYFNNYSVKKESGIKRILFSELAILKSEEELMEMENQEELENLDNNYEIIENLNKIEINKIEEISKGNSDEIQNNELKDTIIVSEKTKESLENTLSNLPTKVIDTNNKIDKYTDIYKSVKIKNESKYPLSEDLLTPNVNFKNKNIIIYHTHTCESYTPTEQNKYEASGNFRTIDLNYSVSRVGKELTNNLTSLGFNVYHDTTFHDYPAYTGSYTRSLSTIKKIISNNDSELIIDLHRDALGNNSNYGPKVKIGEEIAAQLMFVIGTDGGGLEHNNWINNLKLAINIQEKANAMYPGLFKPIILRNSRYNQHVSGGACIIEVGATGNTLEESIISMKYLSKIINEVMK